jgi:flagellin-like hook-associated protein FlgL
MKSIANQALAANTQAERDAFAAQFDALRTQIDQLASDASFNGKNLLSGTQTLQVTFNETATSSLTITGVDYTATGLGITAAGATWTTATAINTSLGLANTASTTLRTQASTFGSNLSVVQNRQDFTKNLINTLRSGADNLVLADTNEEGANLLALQTRQQLASTALSLSAQQDQQVLRLFG